MSETSFTPGPETAQAYREALGCFGTGVTVVTCNSGQVPQAITVNSFTSASLVPPLVLWCLGKESHRYDGFVSARHFAIHIMGEDQQADALAFARNGIDFSHAKWSADSHGTPILSRCLARFDCELHGQHDAGDHTIIVGKVLHAMHRPGKGLVFKRGQYGGFTGLI
ncbi:MAG: flavin reductase family protein [Pseudomonadota bacterium]